MIFIDNIEMMRRFFLGFLIFVALYHVLVTFFSFGQGVLPTYVLLLVRDAGWIIAVMGVVLYYWYTWLFCREHLVGWMHESSTVLHITQTKNIVSQHFQQRWSLWLLALIIVVIAISTSVILWATTKQIFVGIKYTLYYILPCMSAILIGNIWAQVYSKKDFIKRILWIWRLLVIILIGGWAWQIAKLIYPDFFMSFWYGPLGDYVFGAKPPLYYLTWPWGIQRRSGIFSWPNNYWYLLVVFFGLWRYGIRTFIKQSWIRWLLRALYIITLLATLSRGAILWVLIQLLLISYVIYQTKRRTIVMAMIAGVFTVWWLSVLKRDSTVAHLQAKLSSLAAVEQAPWWFGLWSSWPSVHSQWGHLPENFFIQLTMDLWIHGFVLWACFWLCMFFIIRRIYINNPHYRNLLFFLTVWFVWIMLEWLFLHVLEDSMVNYLYFVVWGVTIWFIDVQKHNTS